MLQRSRCNLARLRKLQSILTGEDLDHTVLESPANSLMFSGKMSVTDCSYRSVSPFSIPMIRNIPHTPLAFVAWDYLLTLDREMTLFWGRRRTKAATLFFVNRYWCIAFNFVLLAGCLISPGEVGSVLCQYHRVSYCDTPQNGTGLTEEGYTPNCQFVRAIAGLSYFPFVPWARESSDLVVDVPSLWVPIVSPSTTVFSGLRAYALSQRLLTSMLISFLSLVPSVVHFVSI